MPGLGPLCRHDRQYPQPSLPTPAGSDSNDDASPIAEAVSRKQWLGRSRRRGVPSRWPATTSDADIDIDGDGNFDAGDGFIFREKLINPATGNKVGKDLGHCTFMRPVFDCSATLNLRNRGKIVVEAATWQGEGLVLAVTGGTWKFRGASGLMHVIEGPGGGQRFIIQLD